MKVKQVLTGKTKRIGPLLLVIMVALAGGAAIATWMLSREVTTSMTVIGVYEMELLDEDGVTILMSIAFGDMRRNSQHQFPDGAHYFFDNTGDYDVYVSYSLTDWPADVTLSVEAFSSAAGIWEPLAEDEIWSRPVKDQGTDTFHWRLTLDVASDAMLDQNYTPTITWNAYDTVSG